MSSKVLMVAMCLACAGQARRVQVAETWKTGQAERSPLEMLANLLLSQQAAAAFNPVGPAFTPSALVTTQSMQAPLVRVADRLVESPVEPAMNPGLLFPSQLLAEEKQQKLPPMPLGPAGGLTFYDKKAPLEERKKAAEKEIKFFEMELREEFRGDERRNAQEELEFLRPELKKINALLKQKEEAEKKR